MSNVASQEVAGQLMLTHAHTPELECTYMAESNGKEPTRPGKVDRWNAEWDGHRRVCGAEAILAAGPRGF